MPNYQNGKIYAIKSNQTSDVYIGSTCATLNTRMVNHKSAFKTGVKRHGTAKCILKYADARIELIEDFPCECLQQLLDREGEVTKNTPNHCNVQIQGRTMKEYRNDNNDKLKQQAIDYRIKNKDMIAEKSKVFRIKNIVELTNKKKIRDAILVKCENCDEIVTKCNMARHKTSNRCKTPKVEIDKDIQKAEHLAKRKITNAIKVKCEKCESMILKCNILRHMKTSH